MSARIEEDLIDVEINGVACKAHRGDMIIHVADAAGIHVPRFCYHKKLPIAANCRMCLVEAEMGGRKSPKPLPACATPVADGMKVWTQSKLALDAQRGVMEFLLINHPLDCPICDQGGECELQDLAMGYGRGVSRFTERKRVVADQNLGSLISTEMTRCIHCTRCIRTIEEVGGYKEMGAIGRGENTKIGTYIERSVNSEMSGNVIDVCPVGALTSKPFRYRARAWELTQRNAVAPHDCIGSNIHVHTLRNQVHRAVPRENEAVNEVWLSDRDRFSYEAGNGKDRLTTPRLKDGGKWKDMGWDAALEALKKALGDVIDSAGADQIGFLLSPNATAEELFLAQHVARGLGCPNIDHRLRRVDFRGDDDAPRFPWLGLPIADLETLDAALLVGSNVRKDQPIANHRLRKAGERGASIGFINAVAADVNIAGAQQKVSSAAGMARDLAAIANALAKLAGKDLPAGAADLASGVTAEDVHEDFAQSLHTGEASAVILGSHALTSPHRALLDTLGRAIAALSGSRFGYLAEGANSAAATLAGAVPGRGPGGESVDAGKNAAEMIEAGLKAYVLVGIDPENDIANPAAVTKALDGAAVVVALTSFRSEYLDAHSHAQLPMATFLETSGTYINAEGSAQTVNGCVKPAGDARPGWKILRVLGNLFDVSGCDQLGSDQVLAALQSRIDHLAPDNGAGGVSGLSLPTLEDGLTRAGDVPIYAVDAMVRRAPALQATLDADIGRCVGLNAAEAERLGLHDGDRVKVTQAGGSATLNLRIEKGLPAGVARVSAGIPETAELGASFAAIEINKA